jgi:hypothetical protein
MAEIGQLEAEAAPKPRHERLEQEDHTAEFMEVRFFVLCMSRQFVLCMSCQSPSAVVKAQVLLPPSCCCCFRFWHCAASGFGLQPWCRSLLLQAAGYARACPALVVLLMPLLDVLTLRPLVPLLVQPFLTLSRHLCFRRAARAG